MDLDLKHLFCRVYSWKLWLHVLYFVSIIWSVFVSLVWFDKLGTFFKAIRVCTYHPRARVSGGIQHGWDTIVYCSNKTPEQTCTARGENKHQYFFNNLQTHSLSVTDFRASRFLEFSEDL